MALSNHGLYATQTVFKGTGNDGLLNLLLATLPSTEVKKEIEYCFFLGAVGFSAKSYLSLARMLLKGLVVMADTLPITIGGIKFDVIGKGLSQMVMVTPYDDKASFYLAPSEVGNLYAWLEEWRLKPVKEKT